MSDYFEKAAILWDSDPNRLVMAKSIADAMLNRLKPDGSELVLDYGTGTGNIALQISPSVRRIIAVDSAQNMLAKLREKLEAEKISSIEPREWSVGQDIQLLPQFDIITIFHDSSSYPGYRTCCISFLLTPPSGWKDCGCGS